MTSLKEQQQESPIIYIMVVGFHHKKGCQLEFVYPETNLIKKITEPTQDNIELYSLPKKWRHLPSLALPDGSHNYISDYIYFHLEDEIKVETITPAPATNQSNTLKVKSQPNKTLFGLSCYRQINADELINKDSEVTRNTLQKSVCILSTCPLYASSVRFKLHAITCAYFEQKDFSKTQLLIDAFNSTLHINSTTLSDYSINSLNSCDNYMCLSIGDLVLRYQHKILILFKLLLLQKKCLFQIKPVSSLSNTIMSLVSLIPDMLQSNKHGLDYCSGFFDSIDLVNCELERKANRRNELKHPVSTPMLNSTRKKLKSSKKSLKLTSSSSSSSSSSPSVSISSSPVSMTSSSLSQQSSKQVNKQKSALFDPTASSSSLINNLGTNDDNYTFNKKLDDLNDKTNANLRIDDQPKLSVFKKADSNNQIDIIKSKVFKFVDSWSTPTQTNKLVKSSSSSQITPSKMSKYSLYNDETIDEEEMSTNSSNSDKMNIEDLLKLDFGMPLKLFTQFNILHPYLSLYYLDYFTMINKMNTKLYCTTTLMMSMMNEANRHEKQDKQSNESLVDDLSDSVNYSSSSNISSTSNNSFKSPNLKAYSAYMPPQQQQANYGYTIGATNILFKQRLYDDLDAFIDDTQIDLKQNDSLKKQLQLSTADLRFADYIIKQVNASRNSHHSNKNTPTLLSIKKTSSINNLDKSIDNADLQTNSSFEGSDDWIRLHFKWYLYNMLASMVKEDLCNEIRCEIESELIKLNNELVNIACSSSNSSTLSLATNNKNNDVVDIDEYIEKANTPVPLSPPPNEIPISEEKKHKKSRKLKLSRKNSSNHSLTNSSTLSSISNSYLNTDYSYLSYKDDYNTNYLNEFRQTDCFKEWYDVNRSKLESSLFKQNEVDTASCAAMSTSEAKVDLLMKRLKQLDEIGIGHPFNGQIGVNDIKLKFNFLITTTESGRKLNKAFVDTSKIVNSTGKAVGEALNHAKSTFSSFLNNWSNSSILSPMSSPVQLTPSSSSNLSSKSSKSK